MTRNSLRLLPRISFLTRRRPHSMPSDSEYCFTNKGGQSLDDKHHRLPVVLQQACRSSEGSLEKSEIARLAASEEEKRKETFFFQRSTSVVGGGGGRKSAGGEGKAREGEEERQKVEASLREACRRNRRRRPRSTGSREAFNRLFHPGQEKEKDRGEAWGFCTMRGQTGEQTERQDRAGSRAFLRREEEEEEDQGWLRGQGRQQQETGGERPRRRRRRRRRRTGGGEGTSGERRGGGTGSTAAEEGRKRARAEGKEGRQLRGEAEERGGEGEEKKKEASEGKKKEQELQDGDRETAKEKEQRVWGQQHRGSFRQCVGVNGEKKMREEGGGEEEEGAVGKMKVDEKTTEGVGLVFGKCQGATTASVQGKGEERGGGGGGEKGGGGIFQFLPTEVVLCLLENHSRAMKKQSKIDFCPLGQQDEKQPVLSEEKPANSSSSSTPFTSLVPSASFLNTSDTPSPVLSSSFSFSSSSSFFASSLSPHWTASSSSGGERSLFPLPAGEAFGDLLRALNSKVPSVTLSELLRIFWILSSLVSSPSFYPSRSSSSSSPSSPSSSFVSPTPPPSSIPCTSSLRTRLPLSLSSTSSTATRPGLPSPPREPSFAAGTASSLCSSSSSPPSSTQDHERCRPHEGPSFSLVEEPSSALLIRRSLLTSLFSRALRLVLSSQKTCGTRQGVSCLSLPPPSPTEELSSGLLCRGISGLSQLVDRRFARERFPFLSSIVLPHLVRLFALRQESRASSCPSAPSPPPPPPLPLLPSRHHSPSSASASLKDFAYVWSACSRINLRPPEALLGALLRTCLHCPPPPSSLHGNSPRYHENERERDGTRAEGKNGETKEKEDDVFHQANTTQTSLFSPSCERRLSFSPSPSSSCATPPPSSFSCRAIASGSVSLEAPCITSSPTSSCLSADFLQPLHLPSVKPRRPLSFCLSLADAPSSSSPTCRRDLCVLLLSLSRLEFYGAASFLLLRHALLPHLSCQQASSPRQDEPSENLKNAGASEMLEQGRQPSREGGDPGYQDGAERRQGTRWGLRVMRERGQEEEEEEVPVVGLEEKQNHDQPAHLHQPEDAASLDAGNLLMAAALQVGLYYPSRAFGLLWHGLQRNGEKGRCLYEELLDRASNPSLFDVSSAQANLSSFRTASAIDSSLEGSFSIRQNQEGWYPHFLWSCFLRPRSQDDCRAFFAWTFVTASSLRQIYAAAPWCVSNGSTPASSSSEERSCETPGGRASGKPDGRSASLRTEDTLSAVPRGVREQDDAKERCVDGTARLHQEGSLEGLYAGEYYTGKNKKDYERSGGEREDQEGNNTMLVKTEKNTRRQKVTGIQTVPLSVSLKRQILIFCLAMRHLEEGGVCTSEVCLDGAGRGQSERRGRSTRDLSVQRSVNVGNFHHTEDSSGRGWTGKREEEAKKKIEGEKVEADDGKNSMPGGQRQPRLLEETCQTMGTVELWEKSDQRADGNEEPNSTRECVKPHDRHAATKTEGEEEQDDLAQQAKSEGDRRAKRDRNDVTLFYMFFSSLSVHTLQGLLGSLTENSSVSRPAVSEKKKEDFPRGRQSRLEDEIVYALRGCLPVLAGGRPGGQDRLRELKAEGEGPSWYNSSTMTTDLIDSVGARARRSCPAMRCNDRRTREELERSPSAACPAASAATSFTTALSSSPSVSVPTYDGGKRKAEGLSCSSETFDTSRSTGRPRSSCSSVSAVMTKLGSVRRNACVFPYTLDVVFHELK